MAMDDGVPARKRRVNPEQRELASTSYPGRITVALVPIIALPGSEIAPPLALQIRRCSLGCNGSLLGQTCHARLWPAGPLMTLSRPRIWDEVRYFIGDAPRFFPCIGRVNSRTRSMKRSITGLTVRFFSVNIANCH